MPVGGGKTDSQKKRSKKAKKSKSKPRIIEKVVPKNPSLCGFYFHLEIYFLSFLSQTK